MNIKFAGVVSAAPARNPAFAFRTLAAHSLPVMGRHAALVIGLDQETTEQFLLRSMDALDADLPAMSARRTLTRRQKLGLVTGTLFIAASLYLVPLLLARLAAGVLTLAYVGAVLYRLLCFRSGLRGEGVNAVSDADALAILDEELPVYTVLVPAYREPEVIKILIDSVNKLDYPHSKLEVLILLEADDEKTLAAVQAALPARHIQVVIVPPGKVTTKPRACNYGLQIANGELLTIFDAEDNPEILQLRRAAYAFARLPTSVVCLQARLEYFNADQNMLTKWFTAEYLTWFTHILPGLTSLGAPIPLGGTSNHIRTQVLREVGGWDPYNVTEDADLGIRLARLGYRVGVLDSVTYEEANSDAINWVKQRSRWYKGYLQTWLVHMRHPVTVVREIGWKGFLGLNLFIGGTPLLALLNPLMWITTLLWFVVKPHVIEQIFAAPISYLALGSWVLGGLVVIYSGLIVLYETHHERLWLSALLVPCYWVLMALAAIKATVQLLFNPSYWEKTVHGLDQSHQEVTVPETITLDLSSELISA